MIKLSAYDCKLLATMSLCAGFEEMVKYDGAESLELSDAFQRVQDVFASGLERMGWKNQVHPKSIKRALGMVGELQKKCFRGGRNVQTYSSFCLGILDDMAEKIRDEKKLEWIEDMISAFTLLHDVFEEREGRRYDMCCVAGERAAKEWEKVSEGA